MIFILGLGFCVSTGCKSDSQQKINGDTTVQLQKLISAQDAHAEISRQDITFIDIRTPEEIAEGKITGAKEINFYDSDFKSQINQLDKSSEYVIYCRSGGRSGKAYKIMKALGFEQVRDLKGGFNEYKQLSN